MEVEMRARREVKDGTRKKYKAADFSSCLRNRKQTGNTAAIEADLGLCVFILACVCGRSNTLYQT